MEPESTATGLAFSLVLGAVVGSFLNVVIWRLPRNESIVRPRSHCPHCRWTIAWWANLPIVSWLALRARCPSCRRRISARYPTVELSGALLFGGLFWVLGPGVRLLASFWVAGALLATAFIDAEHRIIPNSLTLPLIPLGLACAWIEPPPSLLQASLGLGLAGGMLWGLSAGYEAWTGRIGLGLGDVKLVAGLGAFLGIEPVLGVLVLASLLGIVQAVVAMTVFGSSRRSGVPFGPALAGAGLAHLFVPGLLQRLWGG
ncbi:MAG: prepilin peptidase [Myxococcota bacterium]